MKASAAHLIAMVTKLSWHQIKHNIFLFQVILSLYLVPRFPERIGMYQKSCCYGNLVPMVARAKLQ